MHQQFRSRRTHTSSLNTHTHTTRTQTQIRSYNAYLCLRCAVRSHRLSFIQFGSYKSQVIIYMKIGASFFSPFLLFCILCVCCARCQAMSLHTHTLLPLHNIGFASCARTVLICSANFEHGNRNLVCKHRARCKLHKHMPAIRSMGDGEKDAKLKIQVECVCVCQKHTPTSIELHNIMAVN